MIVSTEPSLLAQIFQLEFSAPCPCPCCPGPSTSSGKVNSSGGGDPLLQQALRIVLECCGSFLKTHKQVSKLAVVSKELARSQQAVSKQLAVSQQAFSEQLASNQQPVIKLFSKKQTKTDNKQHLYIQSCYPQLINQNSNVILKIC